MVTADTHGEFCQKASYLCKVCYSKDHETITCDGSIHPGSWILNEKWHKEAASKSIPMFQCSTGLEISSNTEIDMHNNTNSRRFQCKWYYSNGY